MDRREKSKAHAERLKSMTRAEKIATMTLDDIESGKGWISLKWSGIQGFGEYTLHYWEENEQLKVSADSECMDGNDDKGVLKALLAKLLEMAEVTE